MRLKNYMLTMQKRHVALNGNGLPKITPHILRHTFCPKTYVGLRRFTGRRADLHTIQKHAASPERTTFSTCLGKTAQAQQNFNFPRAECTKINIKTLKYRNPAACLRRVPVFLNKRSPNADIVWQKGPTAFS